jgi:hypothetical protein
MARLTHPPAILVIHSNSGSGLRVHRVADFLNALEEAYNALFLLDRLVDDYDTWLDERDQSACRKVCGN